MSSTPGSPPAPPSSPDDFPANLASFRRFYELQVKLAAETDLKAALREILTLACELTATDRGCVQLISNDGECLEMFAWRGYADEGPFVARFRYQGLNQGCDVVRVERRRILIEDWTARQGLAPEIEAVLRTEGIAASQSTPLVSHQGEGIGVLSTQFPQPHRPSEATLRLIDMLAWAAADFVERHRAEVSLRASVERLREADRRKDEFLAMLAHELRNPLAPISNASEILAYLPPGDPRARAALDIIRRQVAQLTRLVDDLLDLSRIVQGRIELRFKPVDLARVVTEAREMVETLIRERQHELAIVGTEEPLYVNGDRVRLVQCVSNILANAAKYTDPHGKIGVRLRREVSSALIEVTDSGAGIAPELLPKVFDLFAQGERTIDRARGGLGIGLALVKRLIELHGGQITASSPGVGQGSAFRLRLPRIESPRPQSLPAEGTPAAGLSRRRRALIVDGDQDAANSLAILLGLQGHETRVAFTAEAALGCLETFHPDVALLDIGLPAMSGYALAEWLRAMPDLEGIRLIALTGPRETYDGERTRAAGFDDHLVKPVDLEALERTLAGTR